MNDEEIYEHDRAALDELGTRYAKAKAQRTYLEHFRKSQLALLMIQVERDVGIRTAAGQEREALAHPKYKETLDGLKAAVEEEELARWQMTIHQESFERWRTISANQRAQMAIR